MVLSRLVAAVLVVPLAAGWPAVSSECHGRYSELATIAGVLDAVANLAFLLASRHGLLSLSGVITALYRAGTVLLAVLILKERTGARPAGRVGRRRRRGRAADPLTAYETCQRFRAGWDRRACRLG